MDFSTFTEELSTFDSIASFDPNSADLFLDGQSAAPGTWQADISIPEMSIDPALLGLDDSSVLLSAWEGGALAGEDWQPMSIPETSIDPALMTPFDPFLDPFAGFDPSASNFWDTSSEWQPMSTESYPEITFINPFAAAKDPSAVQALFDFNASSASVPFSPNVSKATPQSVEHNLTRPAATSTNPTTKRANGGGRWVDNPYKQPLVNGLGCPCSLCHGGPVDISSLWKDKKSARIMAKRAQRLPPKQKSNKRKAREMTPEDDSDSDLSSVPDLDAGCGSSSDAEDQALSDCEAPPRRAIKKGRRAAQPAPKKRKVAWAAPPAEDHSSSDASDYEAPPRKVTRTKAPKKNWVTRFAAQPRKTLPKGLEIDMRKW
ncbi:MAG: hypothetical protein LQ346_004707 [Caloplaca aetnensis]|nr:MAG: hypothetical protein LQ346_004707 [Caloplaca aetnensis]